MLGTETWLNSNIHSAEIFPPNYDVITKDRADGYGGVLLAVKKYFIFDRITPSYDDTESVFAKLSLGKGKSLIVGALYRPPSSDGLYMDNMCKTVESLSKTYNNAVMWIGGELNLPDIDRNTQTVVGNQKLAAVNNRFLDMAQNCGLDQSVLFATRKDNALDLFLTNRPTLINRCVPLPGLGDHGIVYMESKIIQNLSKPSKRQIYLWKNANIDGLKQDCLKFGQDFTTTFSPNRCGIAFSVRF